MKYFKKQFYIYVHCRPDGSPFYVGKGHGNRAYNLAAYLRVNPHHKHVVAKHGKENIFIYTRNCVSEQQAFKHERWMKKWCEAQGYRLTNLTDGGEGLSGYKFKPESLLRRGVKISASKKGKPRSTETKTRIAKTLQGNIPWNKGKTGVQVAWNIGNKFSGMFGKHHSAKTKSKIGRANSLAWTPEMREIQAIAQAASWTPERRAAQAKRIHRNILSKLKNK